MATNTVSPFDGAVDGECVVEDFKGVTREISAGDQIYAGERVLTEVKICVTAIGEDCKFGKYNQYINRAASNASPLAEKINKYSQFIYLGVFALCLIVAFLLPVFESSYTYGLAKWGYVAVIIAAVSGLGFFTFASEINLLSLLARGRKCKLGFSGYNAIMNLAKADGVFLDYESVLVDENGELKADSCGAVREIKDTKIKDLSIVCSLDDDKAETVCKTLKIKEYYSRSSQEEKNLELKKAVESGKAVATSCDNYSAIANEKGAVVCFDCEKLGYNGDACLSSDEIAYLPYAIKLAKRTAKIQKINLIIGFGIKALIVLLAVLGIAELWWAVLADSLVSIICALNAFLSSKEVY